MLGRRRELLLYQPLTLAPYAGREIVVDLLYSIAAYLATSTVTSSSFHPSRRPYSKMLYLPTYLPRVLVQIPHPTAYLPGFTSRNALLYNTNLGIMLT